jgi:hypothetical protein
LEGFLDCFAGSTKTKLRKETAIRFVRHDVSMEVLDTQVLRLAGNSGQAADLPPLNVATFRERISGGANQGRARDATRKEVHCGADHREAPRG